MLTNETTAAAAEARAVPAVRIARPAEGARAAVGGVLSHAARRVAEGLGVPITALPGVEAEDPAFLRTHTRGLNALIGGVERAAGGDPHALWEREELPALERGGLVGMERAWRERVATHPVWSRAAACIRREPRYADVWREILGGDFDTTGRGVEYTAGMEVFQAARWLGARTLLRLLGAAEGGVFVDVLGGDGYVWRLLQAERRAAANGHGVSGDDGALIITNDVSPHMFARAGLWGLPTREDATRLSRTFHDASADGVLLAYGTHHIPDMFAAAAEAARVVRPGGRVVMHDFFDEGPAGQWFHQVVDRRSITGHDFAHVGPVQMAAVLLRAGLREVRLHEAQDPFLFAGHGGDGRARALALGYIAGMYGLAPGFPDGLGEMEMLIHRILTYPEVGEVPAFGDDFVYIPRRAVVATAVRAPAGTPWSDDDRALVGRIAALFHASPRAIAARADAPDDVAAYWFAAGGRRWGVTPAEQAEWLAWAETVEE